MQANDESGPAYRAGVTHATAAQLRHERWTVILSHGMGVETAAIWKRWVENEESRPFKSWSKLIVVTSQVGHEHVQTVKLMEDHQLSEMKDLGVRFVELARRGHLEADGIVVLQDTTEPVKLHPAGHYKLGDELLHAGTVPQFSGEHRCALKFKAFVIESWLAWALRGETAVHVWGYNNGELGRIAKSEQHVWQHNDERSVPAGPGQGPVVVFGFNNQELGRVQRSAAYDGPHRIGHYPLLEWDWGRAECLDYLKRHYGVDWIKSACGFCPFAEEHYKATPMGIKRLRDDEDATAEGLFIEFVSMCFNPKGQLYRDRTMASVVEGKPELAGAWAKFQAWLATCEWAVYEVRRIYTVDPGKDAVRRAKAAGRKREYKPKPMVARAVRVLQTGTRAEIRVAINRYFFRRDFIGGYSSGGITRATFATPEPDKFPACEGFVVAAPRTVGDKVRGPMEVFDARFSAIRRGEDPTGAKPRKAVMSEEDYFGV